MITGDSGCTGDHSVLRYEIKIELDDEKSIFIEENRVRVLFYF